MAGYLETFDDMRDFLGLLLGETNENNSRWNATIRKQALNIAQLELAEETRCLEETWETSVGAWASDGDETIAYDDGFFDDAMLNIYWVDSDGEQTELNEVHPTHDDISYDTDDTGTPTKYFKVGRNITLIPVPDAAGTVKIIGQKLPSELDDGTDQSLIHSAFRQGVCYSAAFTLFTDDAEHIKADRMFMKYERIRKRLKGYANTIRSHGKPSMRLPHYIQ